VEALPAFENYSLEEGETFIYTITLDMHVRLIELSINVDCAETDEKGLLLWQIYS
jgi:hypothetical protein